MHRLELRDYKKVRPLFAKLAGVHLCVEAAIAGTNPGQVWVDNPANPQTAFLRAIEGDFVVGSDRNNQVCAALKQMIPYDTELYVDPPTWEAKLDWIWSNPFAQQQPRRHYLLEKLWITDWRDRIPPGFELVRIDQRFLERTRLKNFYQVEARVKHHWYSRADFLEHGFGFVLLHGDTIITRCMADCVVGDRCEMGIGTDARYRHQGLATLTVAATVEHCLARGLTGIGWHCLANNAGSSKVAEKVGFVQAHEYYVFSSGFPAENATDISLEVWREWARFYDRAAQSRESHAYEAACAWALAGDRERPFAILNALIDRGWRVPVVRLQRNWALDALRAEPPWQPLLARLERLSREEMDR
jgi:RimJ/RimL family protein N-acetyltransferase